MKSDGTDHLKGRVAEALVEGMFRRARLAVTRVGRESQLPALLKIGKDHFSPDFMLRKEAARSASERPLHRLMYVEVKYRHDITAFLRIDGPRFFEASKGWPDLYLVLVTDNPEPDRAYFQVVDCVHREGMTTRDLDTVAEFDIYPSTVREYGQLVRQLFPSFDDQRQRSRRAGI